MFRGMDSNGDEIDVKLEDILQVHMEAIRYMYFDYMLSEVDATTDGFKADHFDYCQRLISAMDNLYYENIEAMRKEAEEDYDG